MTATHSMSLEDTERNRSNENNKHHYLTAYYKAYK